jgi:hypothetical protein
MREDLRTAVENVYTVFARHRPNDSIEYCSHCVGADDARALHDVPLRDLTADHLRRFAWMAMSTWGEEGDFLHFLPRILELFALRAAGGGGPGGELGADGRFPLWADGTDHTNRGGQPGRRDLAQARDMRRRQAGGNVPTTGRVRVGGGGAVGVAQQVFGEDDLVQRGAGGGCDTVAESVTVSYGSSTPSTCANPPGGCHSASGGGLREVHLELDVVRVPERDQREACRGRDLDSGMRDTGISQPSNPCL